MNIESKVIEYLSDMFPSIPVYGEVPQDRPKIMLVVDKTGGSITNLVPTSSVVVDSYAESKASASVLNDAVVDLMMQMTSVEGVSAVSLNSSYSDTDTASKEYRYGALFEITHE